MEPADFENSRHVLVGCRTVTDNEVVTGQLTFPLELSLDPPKQGMKPESADQTMDESRGEVIRAFSVGELVQQDSLKLSGLKPFAKALRNVDCRAPYPRQTGLDIRLRESKRDGPLEIDSPPQPLHNFLFTIKYRRIGADWCEQTPYPPRQQRDGAGEPYEDEWKPELMQQTPA
jgi:hypothetical protein